SSLRYQNTTDRVRRDSAGLEDIVEVCADSAAAIGSGDASLKQTIVSALHAGTAVVQRDAHLEHGTYRGCQSNSVIVVGMQTTETKTEAQKENSIRSPVTENAVAHGNPGQAQALGRNPGK